MAKQYSKPDNTTGFGKLPPQAIELESLVLGAVLIEKEAIDRIDLIADDFYKTEHQKIYNAILRLKNGRNPIDMFTVTDELKNSGDIDLIGGAYYITMLTMNVNSAAHIEYHAAILKQKSIARNLISMATEIQEMAYNDSIDIADVIEFTEKKFSEISTLTTVTDYSDIQESISETLNYLQEVQLKRQNNESIGIPTGLKALDRSLNGGWSSPDLIVIGGRPSMGKTQLAVSFAKAAGATGHETLFLSLEMTKKQLIMRMINEQDGVSFYNMKNGHLSNDEWRLIDYKIKELEKIKLNIADSVNIRYLHSIKSLARKLHRSGRLKLMIIDYLQYIRTNTKFGTRDLEIGFITGELKALAKELNIPIILLAQLNRPPKGNQIVKPELSDLRESGNIEQDADVVVFPHRPSYYDENAVDEAGNTWSNRGILYMGKNREGAKNEKILFQHDDRFKKIWDDGVQLHQPNNVNPNTNFYEVEKEDEPF